ncbi:MAG: YihA family ribosome biogenesis GTP-binding protein [Clostridia bacterium]|nr:YihA family ribosome biogenesis GTP-binding protein [Clostridia bacterium]
MKIKNARFVISISDAKKYSEAIKGTNSKEICVVGRSNVGKSSFINMLAGQKKLAKTSSTPGRTRLINLFSFNDGEFILTDLPGYGYAAASKIEKKKWGGLIEGYLQSTDRLVRTLLLIDSRHEPTALDKQMAQYLYYYKLPFTVIATKTDKLSKSKVGAAVQQIATALAIGRDDIIPVSAQSGYGKEEVLNLIDRCLSVFAEDNDESEE